MKDYRKISCRVRALFVFLALFHLAAPVQAQIRLQAQMTKIAAATHGPVGAAVVVVEGGKAVALQGDRRFPMQSVYKIAIGMALLHQVDLGKVKLDQQVHITKAELPLPPHYSPLRDRYPNGATVTISKLLDEMITVSDNTASDSLLNLAGGPQQVTAYMRRLRLRDIVVAASEATMAQNEQVEQYRNWATPNAMLGLLCALQQGRGLSAGSRRRLLDKMARTQTGAHQIKGLLPAGAVVAHKTGSSGTEDGLTRATNDAGLLTLPDGKHLAVVVFVSDTRASMAVQEAVIAKIARAAWDSRAILEHD